jgi:hypothetical protein
MNIAGRDMLTDKTQIDLHVLHALMLHKIGGEVDHADVVAVHEDGALNKAVELL